MNTNLVSWLMRLYPKAWRKEYGRELADMLRARPLTARVCSDVVWSAMWQRLRAVQVATWVGIGLMSVMMGAIASNIVAAPPYGSPGLPTGVRPPLTEQVELIQRPLHSEFYVLVLAGIGFWTAARSNRWPAAAAIRVSTIASIPIVTVGVLMLAGVLDYAELNPGQTPTTFAERGILFTFYRGQQQIPGPAPLVMVLSPLLRLPAAWLWGSIGGWFGRKFADWRHRPVSA